MIVTDLDDEISALRNAVIARDMAGVEERLATIERALERMNPLLRGMTYAHVQSVLGRPQRAAAVLEELQALMPEDGMLCYQLGCYRREARDDEGALAAFTQATTLDPSRVEAWLERGTLLDARGEPQRAIEAYRQLIVRAPTQVDGWRNLGNSLAAMECFDEALEAYRTAESLAPGEPTLAFLVASAYQAKGELETANARLPVALLETIGPAHEVRVQAQGLALGCRFHAVAASLGAHERAAQGLLHAVAQELAAGSIDAFPWARVQARVQACVQACPQAWVVRHDAWLLVCDRDEVRPGPHRFFDATKAVHEAISA